MNRFPPMIYTSTAILANEFLTSILPQSSSRVNICRGIASCSLAFVLVDGLPPQSPRAAQRLGYTMLYVSHRSTMFVWCRANNQLHGFSKVRSTAQPTLDSRLLNSPAFIHFKWLFSSMFTTDTTFLKPATSPLAVGFHVQAQLPNVFLRQPTFTRSGTANVISQRSQLFNVLHGLLNVFYNRTATVTCNLYFSTTIYDVRTVFSFLTMSKLSYPQSCCILHFNCSQLHLVSPTTTTLSTFSHVQSSAQ
eukprot:Gb_07939 [translate_table: standard]